MIDVLIVDDEQMARSRLRRYVEKEKDLHLLGECETGAEAVEAIREGRPELVFLDIDMPDMSGFDVLEALEPKLVPTVIFVTAYDEFAVRAFEVNALDYMVKPFDQERFTQALARARARLSRPLEMSSGSVSAVLEEFRAIERTLRRRSRPWPQRLVVREGRELLFLRVDSIDWLGVTENYVELHVGKKVHLLRDTLANVERRLDPKRFVRVRRDAIVNLDRVEAVRQGAEGTPEVALQGGATLRVGRAYQKVITKRWQG